MNAMSCGIVKAYAMLIAIRPSSSSAGSRVYSTNATALVPITKDSIPPSNFAQFVKHWVT
jgi:hypothetical protein